MVELACPDSADNAAFAQEREFHKRKFRSRSDAGWWLAPTQKPSTKTQLKDHQKAWDDIGDGLSRGNVMHVRSEQRIRVKGQIEEN